MELKIHTEADKLAVCDYISKLPDGKRYNVTISKESAKRTLSQNRLYRLWLACIAAETGNDADLLHEFFKRKFLGVFSRIIYGDEIQTAPTTTALNTEEFTNYLNKVQVFAAEEGIILPNPGDLIFAQFVEKYKNFI